MLLIIITMKLFVGNIPQGSTRPLIEALYAPFGQCVVSFHVNATQGKFAFIDFLHEENARKAKQDSEHLLLQGHKLKVDCVRTNPRFLAETCGGSTEIPLHTPVFPTQPSAEISSSDRELSLLGTPEGSILGGTAQRRSHRLAQKPQATYKAVRRPKPFLCVKRRKECDGWVVDHIGENLATSEGGVYTPMSRSGIYFCTSCEVEIKKKSIYAHRGSLAHQENLAKRQS